MASSITTKQNRFKHVHVKSEQFIPESISMASTKQREYQLLFKPVQISAEDKRDMLTDLLDGPCKQSEKINYLSDRAEIYCDQYQWTDASKDIAEIEALNGGKLNNTLRELKTKANVQIELQKIRQLIGNAIADGVDRKKQFDVLMDHLSEQTVAHLLEDTNKKQRNSKKFKCS